MTWKNILKRQTSLKEFGNRQTSLRDFGNTKPKEELPDKRLRMPQSKPQHTTRKRTPQPEPEPKLSDDELLRKLYSNFLYEARDVAGQMEGYSDGSDSRFYKTYYAILDKLSKLDVVNDEKKVGVLVAKLANHPFMPFETIEYPYFPDDYEEGELQEYYDKVM